MENQEQLNLEEQFRQEKQLSLEEQLILEKKKTKELTLINMRLGYAVNMFTSLHLTHGEKEKIGAILDESESLDSVQDAFMLMKKGFIKKIPEDLDLDFVFSDNFKENLRHYFAVSLGFDPLNEISDNLKIIVEYFDLENKIRNTTNGVVRVKMVDKLMVDRENAVLSLSNIVDVNNKFN